VSLGIGTSGTRALACFNNEGDFMKRILFALFFIFVFGSLVFGQQGGAQLVRHDLVDFGNVFDELWKTLAVILKDGWSLIVTLFFTWFIFMCAKSFIDGKMEARLAKRKEQERVQNAANRIVERKEAQRLARQMEIERSGYVKEFEVEYRSRELGNIIASDQPRFNPVVKDGKYYVWVATIPGVVQNRGFSEWHEAHSAWRAELDRKDSEPLEFDNDDHGRTYDSIVDRDHVRDMFGVPLGKDEEYREYQEPFEEKDADEYKSEVSSGSAVSDWVKEVFSSRRYREMHDYGDDDFEREYGSRRGEFRGGY